MNLCTICSFPPQLFYFGLKKGKKKKNPVPGHCFQLVLRVKKKKKKMLPQKCNPSYIFLHSEESYLTKYKQFQECFNWEEITSPWNSGKIGKP